MGMMINRRRVCGGKSLPYDAEIEYLEVGREVGPYIDTGYAWTTDAIKIEIGFLRTGYFKIATGLFGSQKKGVDTNWGFNIWNGWAISFTFYLGNSNIYSLVSPLNTLHKFNAESTLDHRWNITINGSTTFGTWSGTTCGDVTNVGLFTLSDNYGFDNRRTNNVRVYYFRLTDNNVLVRDFIPVRVGQTGYMYDKVSGQLFGNQGTGSFILGSDK